MPIPLPGDILSRRTGPVTHYGTAVDLLRVLDIVPGGPPRVVSLEHFADGNPVSLQRPHPDDVPAILARALHVANSQSLYNIVTFNCEHLKNFIHSGKPYSESVRTVLGLLAVGVGIWVLARGSRD